MKSKTVAYILWFFLGFFSVHRFYIGKVGTGLLYLVTFQLFTIGWIVDAFLLSGMVDTCNIKNGYYGNQGNQNNVSQNVVVNVVSPAAQEVAKPNVGQGKDVVDAGDVGGEGLV